MREFRRYINTAMPMYGVRNFLSNRFSDWMAKAAFVGACLFLWVAVIADIVYAQSGEPAATGIDKGQLMILATVAGTWIATWVAKKSLVITRQHIPKLSVAIGTVIMVILEYALFKQLTLSGLFNGLIAGLVTGLAAVGFHNTAVAPKKDKL